MSLVPGRHVGPGKPTWQGRQVKLITTSPFDFFSIYRVPIVIIES